jgi:rhamnogalacturonyl hydrolase YesR
MLSTLKLLDLSAVRVSGALDLRIQLALSHLLAERGRILGGEGFGQAWGADQQGRWIGAVALAAAYNRQPVAVLAGSVHGFLATQEPNGFFGRAFNSLTWWGAGRGLIGLLEYWETTRDDAALAAATRLGDFYLANFPLDGNGFATHHGGHTEGLVALWRATGRAEFLELARKIPATETAEFGKPGDPTPGQHTHSYLSAARGCVDLFLATGEAEFLQRAQAIWDHVLRHQMWVSGGISEGSHYVFETRDETCAVADWLRLSLKLWQATGSARYLDVAEHVLLNHLGFDQDHSGGFCSFRSVGDNPPGQVRDIVTWFCCSMHGLRALLEAVRFVYAYDDGSIAINLFTPSEAHVSLAKGRVRVAQAAGSPFGPVRISLHPEGALAFTLHLRVPAWATSFRLTLNGQPVTLAPVDGHASIRREWQPGDTVEIAWEARLQLVPPGVNSFSAPAEFASEAAANLRPQTALVYGPLALMLDPSLNIYEMFEWERAEIAVPRSAADEPLLTKIPATMLGRGSLAVPEACFMTLARRRNGPSTSSAGEDWKLAFLVPIAEITDRWTSSWSRVLPYEVRNDVRLLEQNEVGDFQARLNALFNVFVRQRQSDTAVEQN